MSSWMIYFTHKILNEKINNNKYTKSSNKIINKTSQIFIFNYHNELFNILWL